MYFYGQPHMAGQEAGRPARTYIQQLCVDTRFSPEVPPETMNDKEKWRKRVRDIRADGTTWWWWWWWWMLVCFIEYYKNVCFIYFLWFGWLRDSVAAIFCWWVINVDCYLLYLFLMASALRGSRNSGLIEITFLSQGFEIFWYKISIPVFLLMQVYLWKKW